MTRRHSAAAAPEGAAVSDHLASALASAPALSALRRGASRMGAGLCCLALAAGPAAAQELPSLPLDPGATTVSGLSSGAAMAVQLQVAHSAAIQGAGIVSGAPYDCAGGSLWVASFFCMKGYFFVTAEPEAMRDAVRRAAAAGEIDPPEGLIGDRIYLFHGLADHTVTRPAMDALAGGYALLGVPGAQVDYVDDVNAGHAFIIEDDAVRCEETAPDYINDCDIDQAHDILAQMYGPLAPAIPARDDGFVEIDQSLYTEGAAGMDDRAFVYIPEACAPGAAGPCRLHIALHGCQQGVSFIGEEYIRTTGYARWAEANRIVVLFPQAMATEAGVFETAYNPKGCWDWWGYSGEDYAARTGPQIAAIARMAAALGAPIAQ